jgi:copper chaperone
MPVTAVHRLHEVHGALDLASVGTRRLRILIIAKERQHMCGCSTHQTGTAGRTALPNDGSLTLRVEDMTCGHCAGTIKKAVESTLPGTRVDADPASKLVSIRGTADLAAVKAIVAEAGYTPFEAA